MFEGGAVVKMGAVGCSNGCGCRIGAGGCSNGRSWVLTGRRLLKWGQLGFKRALVVEKAPVGFQQGVGGFLGGDRWCQRGSRDGGGGGDADVAADVVEVHEDGEGDADVATDAGVVDDNGLIGDVACHGAANRW